MTNVIRRALAVVLLCGVAVAGDVLVEVRVTSSAGLAFYVDRGSSSGLAEGDRVEFRLDTGAIAHGTIRSLTANSARVELDPLAARPPLGTRGEVTVPDTRPGAAQTARDDAAVPPVAHPPWTQAPESWDKDRPLLAPAFGLPPEERARRITGRAWLRYDGTYDVEGDRKYGLTALGSDATLENPFGDGGALRLDLEAYARTSDVSGDEGLYDYDDTRLRVDRFAYRVGGTPDRPDEFLVGRFMQSGVPDLGLVDGAEWNRHTSGGSEYGVSFGWMPGPYPDRPSFDDMQVAVHYRHAFDPGRRNTLGLAYQNTWHEGEQDRNLFVVDAESRPSGSVFLRASAWIDMYDSADVVKGSGAELTQARLSGTWNAAPGAGLGAFASEQRIPELLRDEFAARRTADVRDSVVDRVGLNGWTTVGGRTRLDARIEHWSDDTDDGLNGEVGASFAELFGARSSLSAAVQWADGSYSSGPGARLQANDTFGSTNVGLGWQSFWFSQKDYGGEDDQIAQHSLFGTVDVPLSDRWDLSLLADRTTGDDVDSWTFGFLLQTRF